jgi:hypothetical protein
MQRLAFPLLQFTETRNKIVTVALTMFIRIAYVSGEEQKKVKTRIGRFYLSWKRNFRNLTAQLAKYTQ